MMGGKTPYILAIIVVLIFTGMYVISKAAFNNGMNSFVIVFYRQTAASLLLLPVALVIERKNLRSMSLRLLVKLFFYSLVGNTLGLNMCNLSMKLTSSTVASALANTVPVITFCLALLFRMEVVKFRSLSGIAKLSGVALCLVGALIIACYTGPSFSPVNHHRAFSAASSHASKAPGRRMWIIGTFLMFLSCIIWSLWIVLQARLLKEYPNKMLMTTVQCVFSMVQCFVVAIVAERNINRWKLHFDISLLAILYTGFLVTGVAYYLQVWCLEIKGPVFLAVWNPAMFVLTIFCSSFFLGENVHLGSILGGILVVCGLYSVLWAKSKESTKIAACSEMNMNRCAPHGLEDKNPQEELDKGRHDEATTTSVV